MKIAVLGTGNVGATLGKKWAGKDHEVIFGVRDVSAGKHQALLNTIKNGQATIAPMVEAAEAAEVIVMALPGSVVPEIVVGLSPALSGKIIVDATNHVSASDMSSLKTLGVAVPNGKLFRAFNTLGWENFETPELGGTQIDLFYCGEPGAAQEIVEQLIADVGLRPIYIGDLDKVSVLDALTRLWFTLSSQQGYGRRLAFKMLTA